MTRDSDSSTDGFKEGITLEEKLKILDLRLTELEVHIMEDKQMFYEEINKVIVNPLKIDT